MNEFHRHSTARMTAKSKISTRQETQNEIYDDKVVLMEGKKGVEYVATAQQSWEKWAELYIEILSIVGEEIKIQFRWKGFDPPFNVGCWFFSSFLPFLLSYIITCFPLSSFLSAMLTSSELLLHIVQYTINFHIECAESFTFIRENLLIVYDVKSRNSATVIQLSRLKCSFMWTFTHATTSHPFD